MMLHDPTELLNLPTDVVLAIDTEFHAERRYTPTLFLIQVCAPNQGPWIIDPLDRNLMAQVGPVLKQHPWLLHAGRHDLVLLDRSLGGVPTLVWDTQIAAGLVAPIYPGGLARLMHTHLGRTLDKSEGLSDWSKRPLDEAQLRYAAADVTGLHDLWNTLLALRPDRAAIIERACLEARTDALQGIDPRNAWRRIPGSRSLISTQAAALQELAAWRDEVAREADQPPGSVVNNHTLLQLAKRLPSDLDQLLRGRRSPKKVLKRHAISLLATIQLAVERTPSTLPQPIRPATIEAARLAWLEAAVQALALTQDWSARLVAPTDLLEAWIGGCPPTGWRGDLLRQHLKPGATAALQWPESDRESIFS